MNKEITKTPKKTTKDVPINWRIPEGISTPFATNMLVQIIEHEFKLSFFEIKPPILLDTTQKRPDSVSADYIGGIIVSADRLPKFIKVLQTQLDQYNAKQNDDDKNL